MKNYWLNEEIKIGDVVEYKIHGALIARGTKMTVASVLNDYIECIYFSGNKLQTVKVNRKCLKRC